MTPLPLKENSSKQIMGLQIPSFSHNVVSSHPDPTSGPLSSASNINSPARLLHSSHISLLTPLRTTLLCCLSHAFVPAAPSLERPDLVHGILFLLLILVILCLSISLNHWHSRCQWHVFWYNANQVFKISAKQCSDSASFMFQGFCNNDRTT